MISSRLLALTDSQAAEIDRLKAAIRQHRDQRGNHRQAVEDLQLYEVLEGQAQTEASGASSRGGMLASCRPGDESRCREGETARQPGLETENARLKIEISHLNALCRSLSHIGYVSQTLDANIPRNELSRAVSRKQVEKTHDHGPGW